MAGIYEEEEKKDKYRLPVNLPAERGFTGRERGRSLLLCYVSPPPATRERHGCAQAAQTLTRSHTEHTPQSSSVLPKIVTKADGSTVNFGLYVLLFLKRTYRDWEVGHCVCVELF